MRPMSPEHIPYSAMLRVRRRQAIHFPFRNRWLAVKVRTKVHLSEMWEDLVYLVRG